MTLYEFANALSRRGHEVNFFHGTASPSRVSSLDQLPDICRRDGVHHRIVDSLDDADLPVADVMFSGDAPSRLGLPCVLVQGYGMLSPEWEDGSFRRSAPKVCVAQWLVDVGISLGVPIEQLIYAPNGIDHAVFNVEFPLEDRPIDVVGLFHPHREKGWPVLLDALRQLRGERPDLRGLVFARNRPPDELPLGIDFVHGPDHRRLARDVYGRCRVFVQASFKEGFGLTPVEAMACGAALVTTDNGGSQDYGLDGETARVVQPGDVAGLAKAVGELLDDEQQRLRLARAGVDHVARFDWDRSAKVLDDALHRYVAHPEDFGYVPTSNEHV
jgi:glycosyltransferase involved in cell wall biosynthesis